MRKLGMNIVGFPGYSMPEILSLIKNAGFESFFSGFSSDEQIGKISEESRKNGLFYETVHAPSKGINNIWLDTEDGELPLKAFIDCADACAHYGVPVMIIHLSSGENAPCVSDIGRSRWDRLVEHAGKLGVTLAFENQRKLANLAFVFELYKDASHVRFCWDNGHEACFTDGMEYMPIFGKKTVALHIHDNTVEYNKDLHYLPFDGKIDFNHVAMHIRNAKYDGTVMLEVGYKNSTIYEGYTPEQYYARAYSAAAKLRTLIDG